MFLYTYASIMILSIYHDTRIPATSIVFLTFLSLSNKLIAMETYDTMIAR